MNRDEILEEINEIDNLLLEAQERLEWLRNSIRGEADEDIEEAVEYTLDQVECARDEGWTNLVEEACGNN